MEKLTTSLHYFLEEQAIKFMADVPDNETVAE